MRYLLLGSLAAAVALAFLAAKTAPVLYQDELAQSFSPAPHDWAGSATCRACHQDQHASWYRTFHRTMTQEATADSVLGQFNGETFRYWGIGVRPVEEAGRYYFEYLDDDGAVTVKLPVLRTVGSHRYQQYLTQTPNGGETYYRIHLLWHMEDQRWMHINGVFLRPDEQGFDDRIAVWNHNCIFCHNTGPQPNVVNMDELALRELAGEQVNSALEARYDSSVAELGISCEACHGPGAEHARRNRNPLRRIALHLTDERDPTIVHPRKVSQAQSVAVCGQCHGQRTPPSRAHLLQWIDSGPTFRAGAELEEHVVPVFRDTEVPPGIDPDLFRLRFWNDGTARLTAYEYQGLVQSPCYTDTGFTCISCHTLHSGDIRGNIPEANRGNGPCLSCHTEYADDISAHTMHAADSSGSLCYDCHMPRLVFGVTGIHRSHRIEVPAPASDAANERPGACTNCHVDKSIDWAAVQIDTLWRKRPRTVHNDTSYLLESLHGGDPVERAVAARQAGAEATTERAWLIPHLLLAMEDGYPSTRNLARKSLLAINARLQAEGIDSGIGALARQFDFIGEATTRAELIAAMRQAWHRADKTHLPPAPGGALLDAQWQPIQPDTDILLRVGRSHLKQIAIGE